MSLGHFLCRDDRERAWLMDMNRRLRERNRRAFGVVTLTLGPCLFWLNPLCLIPVVVAGLIMGVAEEVAERRQSINPIIVAWPITVVLIGVSIAINGRAQLPDISFLMFPLVAACCGFPSRIVRLCVAFTAALIVALMLLQDASAVVDDPPRLLVPLSMVVCVSLIASASRGSSAEHQARTVTDALTGMPNRSALDSRVAELTAQRAHDDHTVGVIVLDIDHFKKVNDTFGHARGDEVLVAVAGRLRGQLRGTDTAYRLGGEEFLVLLPGSPRPEVRAVAERLRTVIGQTPFDGLDVSVSLGFATSEPGAEFDFDAMFAAADGALYTAKREGRNRVSAALVAAPA